MKKKCTKCGISKDISDFSIDRQKKDKIRSWCKECVSGYTKEYMSKSSHRGKKRKHDVDYYKDNKNKISDRKRGYYQKNKERECEKSRLYKKNNSDECKKRVRNHYYNNKSKYLKRNAKRNRRLKWICIINNPFPDSVDVDYHHLNDVFVVPIPRLTHRYYYNPDSKLHRSLCNGFVMKLFGFEQILEG